MCGDVQFKNDEDLATHYKWKHWVAGKTVKEILLNARVEYQKVMKNNHFYK